MKRLICSLTLLTLISANISEKSSVFATNNDTFFIGSGTVNEPYQIGSEADLKLLSELINNNNTNFVNANYIQTTDIVLTEPFIPIAHEIDTYFCGEYNGNYCSIKNLIIDNDYIYNGLFGTVQSGSIINLSVYGDVKSKSDSSVSSTGGIVGQMSKNSTIANCSFTGNVSSSSSCVGGIAGEILNGGTITKNYVNASIFGSTNIGGLVGCIFNEDNNSEFNINHNYMVGNVESSLNSETIGGIIGNITSFDSPIISNVNFYLHSACKSGAVNSKSYLGCTKTSETALKAWDDELGVPFINNKESNDFNNGYPIFEWQSTPYSFKGTGTVN